MNIATEPGFPAPEFLEVRFANGNRAALWKDHGGDPGDALTALGLEPGVGGSPVILVSGGADGLLGADLTRAGAMLGPAVSRAAEVTGAAVVDGGTCSGVMAITGAARARRPRALPVLIGVAPAGSVTYPGGPHGDGVALEPNHTHFVLADSDEWGGETDLLIAAAAAAAGSRQVVVLLAGGSDVAKAEILASVRRRWPVFVVQGTGGLADSILRLSAPHRRALAWVLPRRLRYRKPASPSAIDDPDLREIIADGTMRAVTGAEPEQFARQIAWELQDEPVLKAAWRQFATYDRIATRLRATFGRLQASILLLGVIATLLALIYVQVGGRALHWVVVVIPILTTALIAVTGRRAFGQRWVVLRAGAQAIKASIYNYRVWPVDSAGSSAHNDHSKRQQHLAAELDAIDTKLMQTQASMGPITPFDGELPPKMYGAGRDDDGLSPLNAGQYLNIRVADQLVYYHGRVRTLDRRRNGLQALGIVSGAAGAVLAAAGQDAWLGLTGGVAAAALAYLGYLQVDNTVVIYNQAAAALARLQREWRARSAAQQSPAAFTDLVQRCEAILASELSGWVQQMNDALHALRSSSADSEQSTSHHAIKAPAPPDQ